MNDAIRSTVAAGSLVLGCAGVFGGISLRNRVDLDGVNLTASVNNPVLSTWVASRDSSDVSIPASDYYSQMVSLLKQYYVEPITNDQKLATGSVRGMISSLGDPRSLFLDPAEFQAFKDRQIGIYQGIGVDLTLELNGAKGKSTQLGLQPEDAEEAMARLSRIPRLVVAAVVPGGPADRAGVHVGDQVADIDGHWVVNEALRDKFRDQLHLYVEKKITYAQIAPLRRELRKKAERALLPMRAGEKLMVGKEGTVTVTWERNGSTRTTKLAETVTHMPGFAVNGDVIRLPITTTAINQLIGAIKGKTSVTIDLRNDPEGDYSAVEDAIKALAPSGNYGEFVTSRHEGPTPLVVKSGNSSPPKITLLVDRSTNGPAAIVASALSSHGRAVLKGSEMGGDLALRQAVELSDGSGYTLVTGEYQARSSKPGLVAKAETTKALAIDAPLPPIKTLAEHESASARGQQRKGR